MNDKISKKEILVFAGIIVAMVGSLLYGFFMIKKDKPDPISTVGNMSQECADIWLNQGEAAAEVCEDKTRE